MATFFEKPAGRPNPAGGPDPGSRELELVPETAIPGFAEALLTPEIRDATGRHQLHHWEIAGRDLIYRVALPEHGPLPAERVAQVAAAVVELARLFPADLAQRYGSEPTAEVPYAERRRPAVH